jgi:hypothetical protein
VPVRVRVPLLAVLVVGPFVLAFLSGGYYDKPRLWAGLVSCALVVVAAIASKRPLPASAPGRVALAGLALLAAWTALSISWAPLSTPAVADTDRLLLYAAFFAAALAVLDLRGAIRALEPALALGALAVVLYGLSERLLPGVFELARDVLADGRLSRPLTYYNTMGTVAALGAVLVARVAGDATRATWMRTTAAACAPVLGLGVFLPLSRGAYAALAVGLLLLVLLARDRAQLRALAVIIPAGLLVSLAAGFMDGVRTLDGALASREREGAAMLALLVVLGAVAAVLQRRFARTEAGVSAPMPLSRRVRVALVAGFVVLSVGGIALIALVNEHRPLPTGADTARLTSVESNRYDYWPVALRAFADHPLEGLGSGGFQVAWLREREIPEGAFDAHSLYLETAAELGLVGLAALALFLVGVGWGAVRAYARDPVAATGLAAGVAVWAVHAGLDWLWEMPAVTLPALLLAAGLLRLAETPDRAPPGAEEQRTAVYAAA